MLGRTRTPIRAAAALATIAGAALAVTGPAAAAPAAVVSAHPAAASLAFTHSHHDVILVGTGVILLLVIVLVLRITRRRRETAVGSSAEAHREFPPSADTWHNADLARESDTPLPSFHQSEVVLPTPPGWHPVQGDQTKLAYWDGTQWAAYRQWDGAQWVDAAPVRQ